MEENLKEITITKEDLIEAYIFLKRTIYYENNNLLHLKYQIAEFETNNNLLIDEKKEIFFDELSKKINKFKDEDGNYLIKEYLEKINYKKIIKKLEENEENKITLKVLKENCSSESFYNEIKSKLEINKKNPI